MVGLNLMSGTGGIWMGWHIHMLFGLSLSIGLILFLMWAYKSMKPKQMAMWALWLIIIGVVGALLTSSWGGRGWVNMMGNWRNFENATEDLSVSQ